MRRPFALTPLLLATLATLVALALSTLGGCGDDDDTATADESPDRDSDSGNDSSATTETSATSATGATGSSLVGRTFVSASVTEDGQPRSLVPDTHIELTFHDGGHIVASAGCNTLGVQAELGPDSIVVSGDIESTLMGCDPARQEQDDWLSGLLSASPRYALDGSQLRLESGTTVVVLTDREIADPDRPLEGTAWQLDGIISEAAVSSIPAGTGARLVFSDGRVAVSIEGCNQGSATVEITETALRLGPLAMTRMACPPPGSDVEAAVVGVFDGEISYTIEATSLTLQHPSGNGLTLRAAE